MVHGCPDSVLFGFSGSDFRQILKQGSDRSYRLLTCRLSLSRAEVSWWWWGEGSRDEGGLVSAAAPGVVAMP